MEPRIIRAYRANEIRELIEKSAKEAWRVSKPDAFMAFKWSDHDQKLPKMLELMPDWEPLFGHRVSTRTKHSATTYWVMLRPQSIRNGTTEPSSTTTLSLPEGTARVRELEAEKTRLIAEIAELRELVLIANNTLGGFAAFIPVHHHVDAMEERIAAGQYGIDPPDAARSSTEGRRPDA